MRTSTTAGPRARGSWPWAPRLAAVCEFVGVMLAAIVVQRALLGAWGVPSWKGTQAEMLEGGEADFLLLSQLATAELVVRYGVLLGLGFAIGWWHRRRPLERYGVTRAGRGWGELLRIGVVLWSVGALLPALLRALDDHLPWIGAGPDHWALFPSAWSAEFLLYMAAASFALVPIVEELAFRGYLLNRLREDYGDAGALVLSTVFFALVHTQYFKPEIFSVGMTVALVIGSLGAGYVVVRTGSLVPPIVAHALGNLPAPPGEWSEEVLLALAVAVVVIAWRPVVGWTIDLAARLRGNPAWGATLFGLVVLLATLATLLALRSHALVLALVLLLIGVGGDALDRSAARASAAGERHSRPR